MHSLRHPLAGLLTSLLVAAVGGACGSGNSDSKFNGNGDDDASTGDGSLVDGGFQVGDGPSIFGDGGLSGDSAPGLFDVEPSALQTITVTAGQTTPTVVYKATLEGNPITAAWTVDRGDLGAIGAGPAPQATLQPTGTTGGLVNVIAGYGGKTIQRARSSSSSRATQNGPNASAPGRERSRSRRRRPQLTRAAASAASAAKGSAAGVTDMPTLDGARRTPTRQRLGAEARRSSTRTTRPCSRAACSRRSSSGRGRPGDADAIQITLTTTSGSFSYTGTFGPPPILAQTGGNVHSHAHPAGRVGHGDQHRRRPTPTDTPTSSR